LGNKLSNIELCQLEKQVHINPHHIDFEAQNEKFHVDKDLLKI
jgi:hypothetical protein